jgi:hypothetical protein
MSLSLPRGKYYEKCLILKRTAPDGTLKETVSEQCGQVLD